MSASPIEPLRVVVAGAGVGALEALMALEELGERRLRLTLVAPDDEFSVRAMTVAIPFTGVEPIRVDVADACGRAGAERRKATVERVDTAARRVTCSDGGELTYDALVLATGAQERVAYPEAITFSDRDPSVLGDLLGRVERFDCSSVAVVVPPTGSWPLPAYELAFMIAHHAFDAGYDDLPVHIVTPERIALELFGAQASASVSETLRMAGIAVHPAAHAERVDADGTVVIEPGPWRLGVGDVVALPAIDGRPIAGVPANARGFIPVDEHNRVIGADGVYAVGDACTYPVKHGGLAAQQADTAAAAIAASAGAPVAAPPFRPVLRGMLLTGGRPRFLRHQLVEGGAESTVSRDPLWAPATKVSGRHLSPLLVDAARRERAAGLKVEADLPPPGAA